MITSNTYQRANEWLSPFFDEQTQLAVKELLQGHGDLVEEAFYKDLEFGTGGMRGIMGVGTNRINRYTLGKSTQGLANYLKLVYPEEEICVAIAYDCRLNSDTLAKTVADVFSANGIKVFLFNDLRPTPELSFAVRHLNCHCGIVLTASHNPPEYNGYKVYWKDGGQLVPPQDGEIIAIITALAYQDIKFTPQAALIEKIGYAVDEAFISSTMQNATLNAALDAKKQLRIVFTPLHGTAVTILPEVLSRAGYDQVHLVTEQTEPDGNFPTVKSPNPEEPEALIKALALAEEVQADIVIGTDPDADRLGIAVRDENQSMLLLNGNQTMILMTAFLLEQWQKQGKLTGNQFIGTTIVSTPMMLKLAAHYQVQCMVGLTGFKWIAKMIRDFPTLEFIGGGEESFGYMVGDKVRDKDAIGAALLMCEIAASLKASGSSVYQQLIALYKKHGYYKEALVSITKKGIEGAEIIKQMMNNLRQSPLKTINGSAVVLVEDYLTSQAIYLQEKRTEKIELPKSDVLIYHTEDGAKIAARPSGTEPKIKFYVSVQHKLDHIEQLPVLNQQLDAKINSILTEMNVI